MIPSDLFPLAARPVNHRLLQEGRLAGPMPWLVAIMMVLMTLAAAAGLALGTVARGLSDDLAGRLTVQIVEPDPVQREIARARVLADLGRLTFVANVRAVPREELAALLDPFLGPDGLETDLPMPLLIDMELRRATPSAVADIRAAVRRVSPSAQIIEQVQWLQPLADLVGSLRWLAAGLVLLMTVATAATVVLTVRAALNTHRATIDVMHLLGSTDRQIAALFQRRIGIDAMLGGIAGLMLALVALFAVRERVSALGSGLVESGGLGASDWAIVLLLPVAVAALAMLCARLTVLRALRRSL